MEKFKKQLAAFISIVLIVGLFGTSVFAETTEVDVSGETPATAVNGAASTSELVDFDRVDAKEIEDLTGSNWAARTEAAANEKGLLKGTKAVNGSPIDRDDAAQLIYNALTISDGSSKLPQVIVVSETTEKTSFTIGKNTLVTAPEFKLVTMVADGRETQMDAGTYNNVTLVLRIS